MLAIRLLALLFAAAAAFGGLTACAQRTPGAAVAVGPVDPAGGSSGPATTLAAPGRSTPSRTTPSSTQTTRGTTRPPSTSRAAPRPPTTGRATTSPPTDRPTIPATTSRATTSRASAGIQPCDLLSPGESDRLRLSDRHAETIGAVRICRFRYEGQTLRDSYTVGIEVFEDYGIKDIVRPKDLHPMTIGHHPAASWLSEVGGCNVSLGSGPSSRVDLTVVGGDVDFGCALSKRVAVAVEPRVP